MADQLPKSEPSAALHSKGLVRIGFGLEILGGFCLKAPRLALAALTLIVCLAGYGVSHLGFDNDLRNLYRTDSAESKLLDELMQRFPVIDNQMVLVVSGQKLDTSEGMETLRNIHLDIQFVEGIRGSVSAFSARQPPVGSEPPAPIFPPDLPEGKELAQLIAQVQAHPLLGSKVLSADGKSALIMVFFDSNFSAAEVSNAVLASVDETLELGNPAGLEIASTGGPVVRAEILAGVKRDQVVLNTLGTIVALVLCFLYFRDIRTVFITTLPGVVGVLFTLGTLGLIGHPLNAMTNVLPTLVLVIAFADALHMVSSVRRHLSAGLNGLEAARIAVTNIGPACAMTSVTTAIVFLSLGISGSQTIREFGYAGAWAALMAFVAVITVVPLLSAVFFSKGATFKQASGDGILSRLVGYFSTSSAAMVSAYPRRIIGIGLIAIVLTSWGYASVETHYSYRDFLPDGSSSSATIDRVDKNLGGADTVTVMIRQNDNVETLADPAKIIRQVHKAVEGFEEFASIYSLASIENWLGQQLSFVDGKVSANGFSLPDHLVGQLGAADGKAWLVTSYMREMSSSQSAPLLDRLDEALDPIRQAHPETRIDITGAVPMTDRSSKDLIWSLNLSLVAAIAVTIVLIALTFGSLPLGLLASIPNFLPLAAAGTFLYLFGQGLQITSVVALTVAFGIAVDDTIHLLHDWRRSHLGYAPSSDQQKNVLDSLSRVGPVLIATTIILTLGFATTAASTMPIVRTFGGICVLTIAVALLADLFLLPSLLIVFGKRLGLSKPDPT